MQFKENVVSQRDYLKRESIRLKKLLQQAPKGRLIRKKSRGKLYYYVSVDGVRKSLYQQPKLMKKYLMKEKLEAQVAAIERNVPILERVIERYQPLFHLETVWDKIQAEQNKFYAEERRHLFDGVYYRSKSEMLIAQVLTSYGIQFKYEAELQVNGKWMYPDFVIYRPKDGKIFILEHFGLMQNEEYRYKCFSKLEDYYQEGYVLWDNLILTFDKPGGAMDLDFIDKLVKLYLL